MYSGWELSQFEHSRLMFEIPPIYNDTFQQYLVYQYNSKAVPIATSGDVVGTYDNKEGQQVLIFSIDETILRPDNRILHLSWSRDYAIIGRKPFHSGHPLDIGDWQKLEAPITVVLIPRLFG